ncbi:fused MFS/spermidine synthase [Cohaesibacter intestini]|uniref:fused MFS/spermidine synthase n=1 Tax=Cohaesibacter intestini TaxID=2211145 RepID=UPI000DEA5A77|nr:fused MFS/spermidine synthase [Cohaesibacter intestini]
MNKSCDLADKQIAYKPQQSSFVLLAVFSVSIFLSAFLLFSIQPYFSKLVLPKLGGSPGVWSVAIVFFQGVLLLGYSYAHALTKWASTRSALIIHSLLAIVAFAFLPISITSVMGSPPAEGQAMWLFALFALSVGVPFFAVSANAPLLQAWFSRTDHPHAADPYFLYGSSNIGSFASLFLYIILIEPSFSLTDQGVLWMYGFGILSVMIASCGLLVINGKKRSSPSETEFANPKNVDVAKTDVIWWIVLAALPSGLLVSVTAHISVDIASAPFLWVIPLALFLSTFVFVFRQEPLVSYKTLSRYLPFIITAIIVSSFLPAALPVWFSLILHLSAFFFIALYCHLLLFQKRPDARHLTAFYLWMSFGGFLGGCFTSLLAPAVFNWVAEYPLFLLAVLVLSLSMRLENKNELKVSALVSLIFCLGFLGLTSTGLIPAFQSYGTNVVFAILAFVVASVLQIKSIPLAVIFLSLGATATFFNHQFKVESSFDRSFFGVVKVQQSEEGPFRLMMHGTTVHGAMSTKPEDLKHKPVPLTYYHSSEGMAQSLGAMQARRGGSIEHGAIIGLGTGSMLCHTKPDEKWTTFEIDSLVVKIAKNPDKFRFVSDCAPNSEIIIGDARLTLADMPDGELDYLLVDAFSSDSIPVHLMTQEAIRLYFRKLKPDGILTMHISNQNMNLEEAVAATAKSEGLAAVFNPATTTKLIASHPHIHPSAVIVLARDEAHFGKLLDSDRWIKPQAGDMRPWTDDYSDVLSAVLKAVDFDKIKFWN